MPFLFVTLYYNASLVHSNILLSFAQRCPPSERTVFSGKCTRVLVEQEKCRLFIYTEQFEVIWVTKENHEIVNHALNQFKLVANKRKRYFRNYPIGAYLKELLETLNPIDKHEPRHETYLRVQKQSIPIPILYGFEQL